MVRHVSVHKEDEVAAGMLKTMDIGGPCTTVSLKGVKRGVQF